MPGSEMQNSMFKKTRGYVQEGNPFAVTSCGRRRNDGETIFEMDSPLESSRLIFSLDSVFPSYTTLPLYTKSSVDPPEWTLSPKSVPRSMTRPLGTEIVNPVATLGTIARSFPLVRSPSFGFRMENSTGPSSTTVAPCKNSICTNPLAIFRLHGSKVSPRSGLNLAESSQTFFPLAYNL